MDQRGKLSDLKDPFEAGSHSICCKTAAIAQDNRGFEVFQTE
jgi:hypothetical protein